MLVRDTSLVNPGLDLLVTEPDGGGQVVSMCAQLASQVSIDAESSRMPFLDGIDHKECNSTVDITGNKYTGQGGHHRFVTLNADREAGVDAAILR